MNFSPISPQRLETHACSPSLTSPVYHFWAPTAMPLPVDPLVLPQIQT
jgi:hypothetical protein